MRPDSIPTTNHSLAHILNVQREISLAATDLQARIRQTPQLGLEFPTSKIGKQLEVAARLIAARAPVAVIKVNKEASIPMPGNCPASPVAGGTGPGLDGLSCSTAATGCLERGADHDVFRVWSPRGRECQPWYGSRHGGSASRHGRQGERGPLWNATVTHGRPRGRSETHD